MQQSWIPLEGSMFLHINLCWSHLCPIKYIFGIFFFAYFDFKEEAQFSDDAADKCDDLINNLDNLNNISPDFYLFDDDEFPRITKNSIDGSNTTGAWTSNLVLSFILCHFFFIQTRYAFYFQSFPHIFQ